MRTWFRSADMEEFSRTKGAPLADLPAYTPEMRQNVAVTDATLSLRRQIVVYAIIAECIVGTVVPDGPKRF